MAIPPPVLAHFADRDPVIYQVLQEHDITLPAPKTENLFLQLCRDIIGQQLSTKVASVIEARFLAHFGLAGQVRTNSKIDITPAQVLASEDQALRDLGLSWAKVTYVKNLAQHIWDGSLDLNMLPTASDEMVIQQLTQVKGIGPWTAEMFLIFTLGRPDVFSHGDLGLRTSLQAIYQLSEYTPQLAAPIIEPWSPYRSYASLALWKNLDTK